MSSFVLEKMCGLIQSGVRTDKGFKEVHLNSVAKGLAEHCGVSVCSTQVYNHLRKWRQRWLTISRLHDLSGAQWCEDTKSIVLEGEHYRGHVTDHPKDAEFLNVPIANYDEMHTIFSFGLVTGKYTMGSSEPMGSTAPAPEDADTQDSDTVNLDADKPADAPEKPTAGKRKRGAFADDELVAFTNMIVAAQQEYLTYLQEDLLEDQAIDDAVPLAYLPPEEVHALQGAPPEVRHSQVKDYIIAFLIVVIMRIMFF
ncbi:uncharacterized protein LOC124656955 [Lolium rigidum]|uniref:uncharacterized protein LOC124656955 n=1 Tax=Lolium rigidum TaxID=89674 RepID=UPI001F5CF2B2|nr:uncharacterized protein LOC124656955 [Lolium rigidum]